MAKKNLIYRGFLYKTGFDIAYRADQSTGEPEIPGNLELLLNWGLMPILNDASELDIREAIDLMIPTGCSKSLIRVGSKADGGYLVPNHLEGIDACFSPGVWWSNRFRGPFI